MFLSELLVSSSVIILALLLDYRLGEPKKCHPLIGLGRWITWIDDHLNLTRNRKLKMKQRSIGALAWVLCTLPILLLMIQLESLIEHFSFYAWFIAQALGLYLCIGQKSLIQHAMWVYEPLANQDLSTAKQKVSWIVSRDTEHMDQYQITSATIESVLENGNDAIYGAIFWYAIAGLPGAVLFRMVNTLDAMWGYKNPQYLHFGWMAARVDDVMGYLPARLTALSYTMIGYSAKAWKCWRTQAKHCKSPNGGPVMTAGAGALNIKIGGPAVYHGEWLDKPHMGCGELASHSDIHRACKLILHTSIVWGVVINLLGLTVAII